MLWKGRRDRERNGDTGGEQTGHLSFGREERMNGRRDRTWEKIALVLLLQVSTSGGILLFFGGHVLRLSIGGHVPLMNEQMEIATPQIKIACPMGAKSRGCRVSVLGGHIQRGGRDKHDTKISFLWGGRMAENTADRGDEHA